MLRLILIIGIGGFIGTIARYLLQQFACKFYPVAFPLGTICINLLGCLLIGFFFALSERENFISVEWRMFLTTGICGGFTTFSAFSLESVQMIQDGEYLYVTVYACASVLLGILATFSGIYLTKTVLL